MQSRRVRKLAFSDCERLGIGVFHFNCPYWPRGHKDRPFYWFHRIIGLMSVVKNTTHRHALTKRPHGGLIVHTWFTKMTESDNAPSCKCTGLYIHITNLSHPLDIA